MMGRIDIDDMMVSPVFVLAAAVAAGLIQFAPFGVDLASDVITFTSETGLSPADIISILCIGVVIATNKPSLSMMSGIEMWVAVATLGLVLAPPFAPVIESFIQGSTVVGLVSVIIQAGGFYSLSYLG